MKTSVKENSLNYACTVIEVKELFDIPQADRIKRVVVFGNNVIVGNDVKVGDVMLYFCSGTKLNEEFCRYNSLLTDETQNRNGKKSYISHKQFRVKAIRLKGIISDGILLPLNSLAFNDDAWDSALCIGDTFTDINGVSLCEKYFVPVRNSGTGEKKTPKKNKLKDLLLENQFRFHYETEHFARNLHKFELETHIVITRKIHGSSLILSNVLINKQLKWWEKLFSLFVDVPTQEYGLIWSSGKPKSRLPKGLVSDNNKWETKNQSFYKENIWEKAYKQIGDKIEKGISLYCEIVGRGIQGEKHTYNQEYGIYVYRVTRTNVDGQVDEFTWAQVKKYCEKYGLNHVTEYFHGKIKEIMFFPETDKELFLLYLSDKYLNKSYPDCEVDEGIVLRHEILNEAFKLKSSNFVSMESEAQEKGETNIEDNQDENGTEQPIEESTSTTN